MKGTSVHASVYATTRLGGDHARNQDRALVGTTVLESTEGIEVAELRAPTVLAVFDGLGGHAAGEVASELAARVVSESDLPADETALTALLHRADQALLDAMRDEPDRAGMGTTAAVLVLRDGAGPPLAANVGDSTIWRLRGELIEEVSVSDRWHGSGVLQCLGANDHGVAPHVHPVELAPGDRVLIATDGLTDVVPLTILQSTLHDEPDRGAEQLLELVDRAGFPDDLAFVLVDIRDEPAA